VLCTARTWSQPNYSIHNNRLETAFKLYLKLGFVKVIEENQKYIEAEIKIFFNLQFFSTSDNNFS